MTDSGVCDLCHSHTDYIYEWKRTIVCPDHPLEYAKISAKLCHKCISFSDKVYMREAGRRRKDDFEDLR